MVALLWDSGYVGAAVELEALWTDLGSHLPFSLLCAYPAGLVSSPADADALEQVCRLHSSVLDSSPGRPAMAAVLSDAGEAASSFPPALESTRAARHFVVDALGAADDALVADAMIVTAELAANAVLHARSDFTVTVSRSASGVRISVRDGMPLPTAGEEAPLKVEPGHGLSLVAQIADRWAVEPLPRGKVVWAELTKDPVH
jgi:hypothetical protein